MRQTVDAGVGSATRTPAAVAFATSADNRCRRTFPSLGRRTSRPGPVVRRPFEADAPGSVSSSSAGHDGRVPELTVVVPTRNEHDNIAPLLKRLENVCPHLRLEVLFVDDSTDDTPEAISERASRSPRPVRLIHRPEHGRAGGLGGAVHTAFRHARSELICVMDADLQHPPELIAALVREAHGSRADVVVASRYCRRGDVGGLGRLRRVLSSGSTLIARVLFPVRLQAVSDPLSGFFLVRRDAIDLSAMRPRGFKILLEILLCGAQPTTSEVAFRFGERHACKSKASLVEAVRYVRRLLELRFGARGARLVRFAAVGSVGVVVNTAVLGLLTGALHLWYVIASVLATQVAIVSNYALTELLVFRTVRSARSLGTRFTGYVLLNNGALALNAPLLVVFVSVVGIQLLVANVLTMVLLVAVRFAVADGFLWRSARIPVQDAPK
jgi:dolichol-phosphate mannosyltransferase